MDIFGNAPVAAGFKPEYPGELPTLGFEAIHWMTQFLARPTVTRYEPFSPTREQAEFLLKWYQLDPITGQRKYRRGVIQRPKGWGKAESLDNVVPTPDGYKRFGDLRVGDYVYGADGKPTRVVQVHPIIEDYGYTVTASDGSEAVFHENHTFVVRALPAPEGELVELSVGDMVKLGLVFTGAPRFTLQDPPALIFPGAEPIGEAARQRVIAGIRGTATKVQMRCITVEAPDGQYLTGRSHWVTHNSPFLSAIAAFEALGNCRFAGWDANGRPVGAPWNAERKVEISLLAVSEDQTRNAFEPMKEMMGTDHLTAYYPGLEVMETRILLPFNGMIKPRTASAASFEGTPQVFTIADQTETWLPNNGGVELGAVAKRNMSKTDGTLLEAPNAFVPGAGSFAELTWEAYQKAISGDSFRDSILYDTRDWGEPDLDDPNSVIAGLEHAYGDSLRSAHGCHIHTPPCGVDGSPYPGGWVNINGVLDDVFDPATTLSDAARYFGNKPHAAADAFLDMSQLAAATFYDLEAAGIQPPSARDKIVLGFDGSWGRSKGITDATAIVAMRVSDGLSWAVRIWEQPDTAEGRDWEPPRQEIDAVMRQTINSFDVVDGLFDPSGWETAAAEWENLISTRRVERQQLSTLTKAPPRYGSMMWRGNQLSAVAAATQALRIAIIEKEVMITGSSDLSRHILNAVYRETRAGKILYKESPSSARKIDAAYALMLAHQSRLRVLAKGTGADQTRGVMQPMRIR